MPAGTLSRRELTAALADRQFLLQRRRVSPGAAIASLTPLQAQDPPAPYVSLTARVEGFDPVKLETAINRGQVVKSTVMRATLHLCAASDYAAYAQVARQARLRTWRARYSDLDEEQVLAELGEWFSQPRSNDEIRERVRRFDGVSEEPWAPIGFARVLLPLVQLPPAGHRKDPRRPLFAVHPAPLPPPLGAAETVLRRYLAAFGPASLADAATWAGVAQRDLARAWQSVATVRYRDEAGRELGDLPRRPIPPAGTVPPVRFLARWDQALLAFADRDRILPPELQPLNLGLAGAQTVTVDGRIAASWTMRAARGRALVRVHPHVDLSRRAVDEIIGEGRRTALALNRAAEAVEVVFSP